ncbi:MAG: T9SS type A sorting domain-containing protein [Bacteroidetes bacterium]|nr:T9SS type A sorting domain-containing protein [Bacteroidota bacterium]
MHFDITKKQIDISPLSPGFYFIRIDTGNFTSVQSFVKL